MNDNIFHLSRKDSLCIICGGTKDSYATYHFTTLGKPNKHRLKHDPAYVAPVRHSCNLCEAAIVTGLLSWGYGMEQTPYYVTKYRPLKYDRLRLDKDSIHFPYGSCPQDHKFWQFLAIANNWSQERAVSALSYISFGKKGDRYEVVRKPKPPTQSMQGA